MTSENAEQPLISGGSSMNESRRWTELELPDIRCSQAERKMIPAGIRNPLMQVGYSFLYCFMGNYYLVVHSLWRYLILEASFAMVCCLSVIFVIPIAITVVCSFFPPLFAIGGLYFSSSAIVMWFTDVVINFAFSNGMKRVSYVEEHRMKGSDFQFKFYTGRDSGEDFDLWKFCWNIFVAFMAYLFKRICKDLLVAVLVLVFVLIIVMTLGIGIFICPFIILYILALNFGFTAFSHGFLNRRFDTYFGILSFCFKHHWMILGYGLGACCVYLIPGLQFVHYFFGSIGATRFAVHYEEQKKIDEERASGLVSLMGGEKKKDEEKNYESFVQ